MLVKEIMSSKAEYLSPDISLREVANDMKKWDCGFIPVGENDRLIGAVTDRDITLRCVAEGKDPSKTKLGDVMSKDVFYCFEDDEIHKATESMKDQKIRRLIVLNKDKRMVGILTLGDIASKSHDHALCGDLLEAISQH